MNRFQADLYEIERRTAADDSVHEIAHEARKLASRKGARLAAEFIYDALTMPGIVTDRSPQVMRLRAACALGLEEKWELN